MFYRLLLLFLLVLARSSFSHAADETEIPTDAVALLNGIDLTGWHGMGHTDPLELQTIRENKREHLRQDDQDDFKRHWRVEHGELVNDGHGVYATSDRDYGDIELWVEFKTVALTDSGIYLRGTPQIQIWDTTESGGKWNLGADKGSGGLWNNSPGALGKDPLALADRPLGQWNRLRLIQVGARTTVWLNDQLVVDHAIMENYWDRAQPLSQRGPIQLQTHGGETRWRNLHVREILTEEANTWLARKNATGYESAFNGKDFSGWRGAVASYEIREGVLICRPREGSGGVLFTEQSFEDFAVRLQFQLPPAGNNGLAIRYPGTGGASSDGMCELQVLDSEHPKYRDLDVRQTHGSAYGLVPATRGYLRPSGQWNFQEVTVRGSTIRVELNGSLILDTDLSRITESMQGQLHPGQFRTSGHFGFAGHYDPVQFRNIMIRPLD